MITQRRLEGTLFGQSMRDDHAPERVGRVNAKRPVEQRDDTLAAAALLPRIEPVAPDERATFAEAAPTATGPDADDKALAAFQRTRKRAQE